MTDRAPTRFAAISDIHSNSDALAAVLDDIAALGISDIVNLGDHLSGPLAAKETADILMGRDVPCLRGNHDRWLVEKPVHKMNASDRNAFAQLKQEHINWLSRLQATLVLWDEVFLCHASPDSDVSNWIEKVAETGAVDSKDSAEVEALASTVQQPLMLCGHTHLPKTRTLSGGQLLVNPGSIGCPAYSDDTPVHHIMQSGTPDASYAILDSASGGWVAEHRLVAYDSARMVQMARENQRPDLAQALATGRPDQ